MSHLQRNGIVDPVAHPVSLERAIGNGRREGKCAGIKLWQLDMEIYRAHFTGGHRVESIAFPQRIGTRKIDAQMIAHHEPDIRLRNFRRRSPADSNHNLTGWLKQLNRMSMLIEHRAADDFIASITKTMVD